MFLGSALAGGIALGRGREWPLATPFRGIDQRHIWLRVAGLGEETHTRFRKRSGAPEPQGAAALSWAFRDWRGGHQSIAIDLALFDLLATVQTLASLLQNRPIRIDLTSGFRTPERNRTIEGAAVHSQHIIGRAADIRLAGLSIADVAEIAETAKAPGLGRYGAFIHLDVGKPGRRWTG